MIGVDPYGSILDEPEELNETSVSVYQVQYGNGSGVHRRLRTHLLTIFL